MRSPSGDCQSVTAYFRFPPIRSKANLQAAKDQPCTLQIPGVCTGGGQTTVAAHIRDEHTGRSVKASDTSICDACFACHSVLDGQGNQQLSREEWLFYALRGIQRTIENRVRRGVMPLPVDAARTTKARRASKANKPKSAFPKGRKLKSRNDLRRSRHEGSS